MKTRIVSLSLVFLFIFGIFTTSVSAASYSTGVYSVTANSGVNVRNQPNGSVVGAASRGVTFTVSSLSGDWGYTSSIQCTNGVKSGYVYLANCQYISSAQTNYYNIF